MCRCSLQSSLRCLLSAFKSASSVTFWAGQNEPAPGPAAGHTPPWRAVRICGLHTLPHGHCRAGHSLPLHQVVVPVLMHREQDTAVVSCSL